MRSLSLISRGKSLKFLTTAFVAGVFALLGGMGVALALDLNATNSYGFYGAANWWTLALTETVDQSVVDWVSAETLGTEYCNGNLYYRTWAYNYVPNTWIAGDSDSGIYLTGCGAGAWLKNQTWHDHAEFPGVGNINQEIGHP